MTDDDLRVMWRKAGGRFHGPNIETGTMPESQLLPFLRSMALDAERYRWMRGLGHWPVPDETIMHLTCEEFDTMIDEQQAVDSSDEPTCNVPGFGWQSI